MKALLRIVGMGLLGGLAFGTPPSALARLEVGASVQISARADFHVPLAAHGSWVEVGSYGRCWRPARVAVGWRPYCDGTWVWTDCGWYWQSDEPWAWACYHYGTWVYDSDLGWVWIPDIEWAPAWVHWRVGGGYIGWAPCPPRGVVVVAPHFSFVAVGRFHDRVRPSSVVINDTTIINNTKVITDVKRVARDISGTRQKVVFNEGPGVAEIQKVTGKKISSVPVQEAARQTTFPQVKAQEASEPTDKTKLKTAPEPNRPANDNPAPSVKPTSPGNSPSKKQIDPSGEHPAKDPKDPNGEPPQPEGKDKAGSSGKPKSKDHDKGKP